MSLFNNKLQKVQMAMLADDVQQKFNSTDATLAQKAQQTDLNTTNANVALKANQNDLTTQASRIDNLVANVGNTSGNSEIVDLRVSGTGVTYASAGNNIRALESQITNMPDITQYPLNALNTIVNTAINEDGTINTAYYPGASYYVAFFDVSNLKSVIINAYMAGGAATPQYAVYSCATSDQITASNKLLIGTYTSNADKTIIVPNDAKLLAVSYYQNSPTAKAKSKNLNANITALYQNDVNMQAGIDKLNGEVYMDVTDLLTYTTQNSYYFNQDGSQTTFGSYCSRVYPINSKYYKASVTASTVNGYKPYVLCFADAALTQVLGYFTYTDNVELTFNIPSGTQYIAVNTVTSNTTTFKAISKVSKLDSLSNSNNYSNRLISGLGDSLSTNFKHLDKCVSKLGMVKGGVQNGGARVSGTGSTAFWQDSIINGLSSATKILCILGGTNDGAQNAPIGTVSLSNYDINTFVGAYNVLLSKLYYKFLGLANGYYSGNGIDYSGVTKLSTPVVAIPIFLITPPLTLNSSYQANINAMADAVKQIGKLWGLPVIDSNDIFANPITWTSSDQIHGVMDFFNYLGDKLVNKLNEYEASMTFFDQTLGIQYTITTSYTGGTVTVTSLARQGDTVQFVINGTYSTISVKDSSNNVISYTTVDASKNSYQFTMPASNVTITVS